MNKPVLTTRAFEGIDINSIDYKKDILYVIESIINQGTFEDFKALVSFYGDSKIKKAIINTTSLGDKEINFCCLVFNLKPTDFKKITNRVKSSSPDQNNFYSKEYYSN